MNFLLTLSIGIVAGVIDVLPMIKMKVDKYSIASAFIYYLIVPFVVFGVNWFGDLWWLRGGVVSILMAIPIIIFSGKRRQEKPGSNDNYVYCFREFDWGRWAFFESNVILGNNRR